MQFQAMATAPDYGGGIHLFPAEAVEGASFAETACRRSVPLAKLSAAGMGIGLLCPVCLCNAGAHMAASPWAG